MEKPRRRRRQVRYTLVANTEYVRQFAASGGRARGQKLSAEELSKQGREAVEQRWKRYYALLDERLQARREREKQKAAGQQGMAASEQ